MTAPTPATAEIVADLLYEIGKDALTKRTYDVAIRWLERAYDVLGEQDLGLLSPEVGELRLSTMQGIGMSITIWSTPKLILYTVQAYMKLKTPEAHDKAWQMLKLLETVSDLCAV